MNTKAAIALAMLIPGGAACGQGTSQQQAPASSNQQNSSSAGSMDTIATEMHENMQKIHQKMMETPMSGDTDKDFAQMMIHHHQGAIDMAKVFLKSGRNPELRKMAQKMIDDQSKEITELKGILDKQVDKPAH